MQLVVDSNVLFTFFWRNSAFQGVCAKKHFKLYSPAYALDELKKHASEIVARAKISLKEFDSLKGELADEVEFAELEQYSAFLKEALKIGGQYSDEERIRFLEDVDFFALAMKLQCPLWSNDALLKKQSVVHVLTTKEILLLMD